MNKLFELNEIKIKKQSHCLSCGATENNSHRKYCSIRCRQNLRQKLNIRNGLLQALNTRYATFYFSDTIIILDIVPHGTKEIFRYISKRTAANNPAADFSIMTNALGNAWWAESKRTNKNYLASQHVLKLRNAAL
jgi:predicted nucleic acid-binding Zn ribbon protein